jgi:YD repeat-containing protein
MTAEQLNGSTTSYTYDSANQLTAAGSATYSYDSAGNRTSGGSSPSAGNRISQDANWTYSYDADGNRTGKTSRSDGSYWQYDYNAADQMTAARNYSSFGDMATRQAPDTKQLLDAVRRGDKARASHAPCSRPLAMPGFSRLGCWMSAWSFTIRNIRRTNWSRFSSMLAADRMRIPAMAAFRPMLSSKQRPRFRPWSSYAWLALSAACLAPRGNRGYLSTSPGPAQCRMG